jgi:hypothetical protein
LLAGTLEILALVFLILFFAVELPQGDNSMRFGYLSDVTPILTAPVQLALAILLFLLQRKDSPALGAITAILGITGIGLTAWTNIRFVSAEIGLEKQIELFYLSMAFFGSWHILVNMLARREGLLPSRLAAFGVLVGIGQLVMFLSSLVVGGYEEMFSMGFDRVMQDPRLLLSLAIGIPMVLLGYVGSPFWLVWLGRALIRDYPGLPAFHGNERSIL